MALQVYALTRAPALPAAALPLLAPAPRMPAMFVAALNRHAKVLAQHVAGLPTALARQAPVCALVLVRCSVAHQPTMVGEDILPLLFQPLVPASLSLLAVLGHW